MAGTRDYSDGEIIWKQRKRNWCRTKFSFTVYTLTDSELIIEQGIIRQKIDSIPLYRILDITVERTLLQRMFGLSTVVVNAYDVSTGGVARLVNVIDGMNVRRLLMRVVSGARSGAGVRPREYMDADSMMAMNADGDGGMNW